ncbi:MAG TPA: class I SAM-dependent methyltransferase [Roseiflexaceae bacterium]|nr:class I SAM-dependent methyltransferase [Roseiflexaceae bacterium]
MQEPTAECEFIEQVWREKRGRSRKPRSIREDFCGTAAVCAAWVQRRRGNTAVGVDLHQPTLDWGFQRFSRRLMPSQLKRLRLIRDDVRHGAARNIDSVLAMNFSHFIFKTRSELRRYYKSVHRSLKRDGIFILDAYGGSESFEEMQEERDLDGFTYVWDQNHYNPITNHVINHIHFKFPDGTKMERAFTYDWRLWTLPELQEVLLEAGFKSVSVYWEGTDAKTGEGNGEWAETRLGEACQGWIAYLAAMK